MNVHDLLVALQDADKAVHALLAIIEDRSYREDELTTDDDDNSLQQAESEVNRSAARLRLVGVHLAHIQQRHHVEPDNADRV